MNLRAVASALAVSAAVSTSALATVIDFNAVSTSCVSSYSASGVTFSATDGGNLAGSSSPNGTLALLGCNSNPYSTIRAQFASTFSGTISVDIGDFDADADLISLTLFNAANTAIGTASLLLPASFTGLETLTVSASNVAYAIFGGVGLQGSSVYSDNFTFVAQATTVPEPATLALLGLGLIGLRISQRRRS